MQAVPLLSHKLSGQGVGVPLVTQSPEVLLQVPEASMPMLQVLHAVVDTGYSQNPVLG